MYKVGMASMNDYLVLDAGEAIAFRQILYVNFDSKFYVSQGYATTGGIGFAMNAGNLNDKVMCKCNGYLGGFSGLDPTKFYGPGPNGTLMQVPHNQSILKAITPEIGLILQGAYRMAVQWTDVANRPLLMSEEKILTSSDITNEYIELNNPLLCDPSGVAFIVENGPVFYYGTDYECLPEQVGPPVVPARVSWSGKALAGKLLIGMKVRVTYWSLQI